MTIEEFNASLNDWLRLDDQPEKENCNCKCYCHSCQRCMNEDPTTCIHCQKPDQLEKEDWEKYIRSEKQGLLKSVLLGKDIDPDYYKKSASEIDHYLREKTLGCYIPDELITFISGLLAKQKEEIIKKLEGLKKEPMLGKGSVLLDVLEAIKQM